MNNRRWLGIGLAVLLLLVGGSAVRGEQDVKGEVVACEKVIRKVDKDREKALEMDLAALTAIVENKEGLAAEKQIEAIRQLKANLTVREWVTIYTAQHLRDFLESKGQADFADWRRLAAAGSPAAQYLYGLCFAAGAFGSKADDAEAVKWYRKAADQGYAPAQKNLGSCYVNGQGVAKDEAEAVKWYRKAADQGNAMAQNNLGVCYVNGQGVAKDEAEAVKWYRKAADQGYAPAQNELGNRDYISKTNLALAEATRKVIHKRSDSPSERLAEINTLKYAFIDPNTGRVSFIGTYDRAYASGPIPYADLLAEALDNPYPAFSLDEGSSKPARQAIKQLFDKEMRRIATDLDYGVKWMQNVLLTILNSREPIPEKLVIDQRLKQLGIKPQELAAYLGLKKSNANITSEEQYRLWSNFVGKLFASVGIEERYGKAVGILLMTQQMVMRGEEDKAIADGLYKELGELLGLIDQMQRPMNMRQLWVMFYGNLLKGMGVPANQVNAMANRVDIHSSRWDSELAPAFDARYVALAKEAFQRNILKSFVLTQAFLKRMYSLPTVYSRPKLFGKRADSPLTRVMFDADYALKYVTTLNPDTAALPGYLSAVEFLSAAAERLGRSDELKEGEVREWIYPGELRLEPFTDNSGVRFASATLRIGVEPLDDASKKKAWLWPVLSEYASRLNERYDDYARLYPSLYVMRETEKVIALARWIKQNGLQVDVPKARPVANPVPDRVEGFIDIIYVRKATGATDDLFLRADGGVVFDQNEGDGWIKIQPSITTTRDVLQQLAASVALAEQASAAALSGNLESARDLAQSSADAMIGQIDASRLPEPVMAPMLAPNESVAGRAEVAQAAIAATEVNTAALAKTRTDLQQAEPLKTSDPARYAQIQQQSQVTVTQSEQNLRHLRDMLEKYRLKPADSPAVALDLRRLDPNKQLTRKPVEANSGGLGRETVKIPTTAQPEDWSAKCSKWIAELDQVNNQIAGTREVLLKLNASIQTDRKLFDEWEKAATEGFDRCVDLAVGVAIDTGLGYLVDRYDDINRVAATLPDPKGVEKYRLIASLFKRLEEAKGTKDVADLAASEGKTDAEFFEMLRDGIGQIAELVGPDKWFPARVWRYGSLGWDMAYNLTELGLVWKNVSALEANNARYAEAVRKLAERMQELIKRQKELRQKIEAGEPVDYNATDR